MTVALAGCSVGRPDGAVGVTRAPDGPLELEVPLCDGQRLSAVRVYDQWRSPSDEDDRLLWEAVADEPRDDGTVVFGDPEGFEISGPVRSLDELLDLRGRARLRIEAETRAEGWDGDPAADVLVSELQSGTDVRRPDAACTSDGELFEGLGEEAAALIWGVIAVFAGLVVWALFFLVSLIWRRRGASRPTLRTPGPS